MGYSTDFEGAFKITPKPDDALTDYVNAFAETRHMRRDVEKIKELDPDWAEHCLDGQLGYEGTFYIQPRSDGFWNQFGNESVLDHNTPPRGVPGLWCQWVVEGDELVWDQGEKFYHYDAWLEFLAKRVFEPKGYAVEGEVRFRGEEFDDVGTLSIHDGEVSMKYWR